MKIALVNEDYLTALAVNLHVKPPVTTVTMLTYTFFQHRTVWVVGTRDFNALISFP